MAEIYILIIMLLFLASIVWYSYLASKRARIDSESILGIEKALVDHQEQISDLRQELHRLKISGAHLEDKKVDGYGRPKEKA